MAESPKKVPSNGRMKVPRWQHFINGTWMDVGNYVCEALEKVLTSHAGMCVYDCARIHYCEDDEKTCHVGYFDRCELTWCENKVRRITWKTSERQGDIYAHWNGDAWELYDEDVCHIIKLILLREHGTGFVHLDNTSHYISIITGNYAHALTGLDMVSGKLFPVRMMEGVVGDGHGDGDHEEVDFVQDRNTPGEFICPITRSVMQNPVIASDGHSYESYAIKRWLQTKSTSPMTGAVLAHKILTVNRALRGLIRDWVPLSPKKRRIM